MNLYITLGRSCVLCNKCCGSVHVAIEEKIFHGLVSDCLYTLHLLKAVDLKLTNDRDVDETGIKSIHHNNKQKHIRSSFVDETSKLVKKKLFYKNKIINVHTISQSVYQWYCVFYSLIYF
jgi:hypothetical protein